MAPGPATEIGNVGFGNYYLMISTAITRPPDCGGLKAAGIGVRTSGAWGQGAAKPANGVTTDLTLSKSGPPCRQRLDGHER